MEVLNLGSLNIDHVYQVPHFVVPGETLTSLGYQRNAGGKGLNQSVALARAGVAVSHAGKIGEGGEFLLEVLREAGADVRCVLRGEVPTGHAIIQVDPCGQNDIILFPGANRNLRRDELEGILASADSGCWLLLQNEINDIPFIMERAHQLKLHIAINPAPCGPEVLEYPMHLVDLLFVNEIEGATLAGMALDSAPEEIANALTERWPQAALVLTLGKRGALYAKGRDERYFVEAESVKAVDTTSAGDTFCGYFMAAILRGYSPQRAMAVATHASAITVSRPGAAVSIPTADEIFK